jgi:pyrimidine operon attenuation protein/uracil phosphoribosyltransferase
MYINRPYFFEYENISTEMVEHFIDIVKYRVEFQSHNHKTIKTDTVIVYVNDKKIPMVHFVLTDK